MSPLINVVSIFRELGRAEVLLAEQAVDRAGADAGKEGPLRIHPGVVDVGGLLLDGAAAHDDRPDRWDPSS